MTDLADFIDTWARVGVKVGGTRKGIRREIDFVSGASGLTITGTDSPTGEKVTVTFTVQNVTDAAFLAAFLTMGAR